MDVTTGGGVFSLLSSEQDAMKIRHNEIKVQNTDCEREVKLFFMFKLVDINFVIVGYV